MFDDPKSDPVTTMQSIYRFLGADYAFTPEARVIELYRDEVRRLGDLIGRDLSSWLEPRSGAAS